MTNLQPLDIYLEPPRIGHVIPIVNEHVGALDTLLVDDDDSTKIAFYGAAGESRSAFRLIFPQLAGIDSNIVIDATLEFRWYWEPYVATPTPETLAEYDFGNMDWFRGSEDGSVLTTGTLARTALLNGIVMPAAYVVETTSCPLVDPTLDNTPVSEAVAMLQAGGDNEWPILDLWASDPYVKVWLLEASMTIKTADVPSYLPPQRIYPRGDGKTGPGRRAYPPTRARGGPRISGYI